jgi:hypothetical protein
LVCFNNHYSYYFLKIQILFISRKPGCRRIVEWAKKTGRIQGAEQQELLEFARKIIETAEKDGDIIQPSGNSDADSHYVSIKKNVPLIGSVLIFIVSNISIFSHQIFMLFQDGSMSFDPDQS